MGENENQQLFILQKKIKDGDPRALTEMYEQLVTIAYKKINARSNSNAKIKALSADERKQKAHDAATYIIEQYLKRPDFEIIKSFNGYLNMRIAWELYGREHQRKCDQMLVLYGDVPASKEAKKKFYYIVKDNDTGKSETFESFEEMHLDPRYKTLRKKRLVEGIRYGKRWKNYSFDILEVNE